MTSVPAAFWHGSADERDPKTCPRCGHWCVYDGWGHVHGNGLGIGPDDMEWDEQGVASACHACPAGKTWKEVGLDQ